MLRRLRPPERILAHTLATMSRLLGLACRSETSGGRGAHFSVLSVAQFRPASEIKGGLPPVARG